MQRKRFFRAFFSVFLSVCCVMWFSLSVSAAELFGSYHLTWSKATSTSVPIQWYVSGTLPNNYQSNISAGIQYWDSAFSALTTSQTYSDIGEGKIIFQCPTETWWESAIDPWHTVAGETWVYNRNGTRITENNVSTAGG